MLTVSAGSIPFVADAKTADSEIAKFTRGFGANPTWAAALGRDAAILARKGLAGLPLTTTTDPKEVAKRRDAVADALVAAKTALWTSEATGFTSHELGRTLKVVESPHGK